jgi:hypothetical protein
MKLMIDGERRVRLAGLAGKGNGDAGSGEGQVATLADVPEPPVGQPLDEAVRARVLGVVHRWLAVEDGGADHVAEVRALKAARTVEELAQALQQLAGTPILQVPQGPKAPKLDAVEETLRLKGLNAAMALRQGALAADGAGARLAQLEAALAFDLAQRGSGS